MSRSIGDLLGLSIRNTLVYGGPLSTSSSTLNYLIIIDTILL